MDPKEAKHEDNPQLDILIEQVDNVAKLLEGTIKQRHDSNNDTQLDAMIIELKNLSKNLDGYAKTHKEAISESGLPSILKNARMIVMNPEEKKDDEVLLPTLEKIEKVLQSILDHETAPEEKDDSMMKHHEAMMSVLSDIKTILATPEQEKEGPEDVKVVGEVDIKKPKWYESFMYDEMAIRIKEVFSGLTLKVKSDKPLDVRMVDAKGNPVEDLGGGKTVFAGSNAPEVVGLKDKTGNQVNPSTENSQAQIITLLTEELQKVDPYMLQYLLQMVSKDQSQATDGSRRVSVINGITFLNFTPPSSSTNVAYWGIAQDTARSAVALGVVSNIY